MSRIPSYCLTKKNLNMSAKKHKDYRDRKFGGPNGNHKNNNHNGNGNSSKGKRTGWRGPDLFKNWEDNMKKRKFIEANENLRDIKILTDTHGFNKAGLGDKRIIL